MTMNIYMRRTINGLVRLCSCLLLALAVGCSSSKPDRGAAFLDSKPEEGVLDESKEAERLRKLQLVRVWSEEYEPDGTLISEGWKDVAGSKLGIDIGSFCSAKFGYKSDSGVCSRPDKVGCTDSEFSCDCEELACSTLGSLCVAHTFAELAAPRSGAYRLEWYEPDQPGFTGGPRVLDVPPQPLAVNAAIFRQGTRAAQRAMYMASRAFLDTTDICAEFHVLVDDTRLIDESQLEAGDPLLAPRQRLDVMFSNTFLEAYRLYQDLAGSTVDAVVSVADWQRSHPSLTVQIERAVLGDQLSRAEAAHLLVGGAPGLQQSRELSGGPMGLCSSPELSGPAQRALQAIRDTGPDPQLFKDPGSLEWDVTRRLSALGLLSVNADTAEMRDVLDLRGEDFIEAARYLEQEFVTYSRTLDPSIRITAGRPSNLVWHASTANPPPLREDVFYATIARESPSTISQEAALSAVGLRQLRDASDLSSVTDAALSVAAAIVATDFFENFQSNADVDDIVEPALAPLIADGREERIGRWLVCSYAGDTWRSVLGGFTPADALIIVKGEEGLECAVQGKIEGIPCTLDPWIVRTVDQNFPGTVDPAFDTWVDDYNSNSDYSFEFSGERRFYLMKPRDPLVPPVAGQYTALSGVQIPDPTSTGACLRIPIVPAAERLVADILKPSRKWCSQSKVSCAKEDYDARLPLEDELSEDNSGVENSWRTYLNMAKQAAAEADLLGEQVVTFGLELSRREEEVQLREQAQEVAVLQELENLQTICGASVDISGLDLNPWNTAGGDCPCTIGLVCFSGKCIPDLAAQIDSLARNDRQYQRLAECISEDQEIEIEYVTPGDKPLVAWRRAGDPNSLCQRLNDDSPRDPCPVVAPQQPVLPDDQVVEVVPINETLNYFRSDAASPPDVKRETCDDLRTLRESTDPGTKSQNLQKIKATNFFHPALLVQLAAALGWESRLGGYGAVLFNGVPVFKTGEFGVSTAETGWPCGPLSPPAITCPAGPANSLFCSNLLCAQTGQDPGLAFTNERLRNAIIALRLSLGMDLKGISFPLFIQPNYQATHSIPEPRAFTRTGPGGITINNYVYTDFKSSRPTVTRSLPFGTIVRHDVDAAIRVGWCWGPDTLCPGEEPEFVPWDQSPGSVPTYDIAFSEIGDFMLDSFQEQRRVQRSELDVLVSEIPVVGGALGSRLGTLECKVRNCEVIQHFIGDWRRVLGHFDGNFWIWANMAKDSLFMQSGNAENWFKTASSPSLGWSNATKSQRADQAYEDLTAAIHEYLKSGVTKNVRFQDDFKVGTDSHALDVLDGFKGLQIAERGINLGIDSIVDGMELLCEVAAQVQAEPSCQMGTAPDIRSPSDLTKASNHLACMARQIEARLGNQVFSHFPKHAVDALRRESGVGSFPQVGGDLGVAISGLRGALVELADIGPQIAGQLSQMSTDVEAVRIAIRRHEIASEIAEVEFQSLASAQLTACAEAVANLGGLNTVVNPGSIVAAGARCFNSFYQVHLGAKLESLKQQDAGLATEGAVVDFHSRFSERAQLLERLDTRANAAMEGIDAQLAAIENLRLRARRSLHRAMYLNSLQAEKQMEINSVMRRRINTANIRYGKAFKNAQRLAFVAKRAIEQRLGMRLSDMHEDLPLVEKPSSWEPEVCANTGIDWSSITAGTEEDEDPNDPSTANFADKFIGDYVRNLENVVESYRMVHAFHEGLDTAVVSLKDDVYRSQSICDVPSTNLLYHAGQLDQWKSPATSDLGWRLEGCATQLIDTDADGILDTEQPLPDCVDVRQVDVTPTKNVEFGSQQMRGYRVTFGPEPPDACSGCGLTAATRVVQSVELGAGDYLLSWYHQRTNEQSALYGAGSVTALLADGSPAPSVLQPTTAQPNEWQRSAMTITVPSDQVVSIAVIPDPSVAPAPHEVLLGGLMLEYAQPSPSLFADTDETRTRKERACSDPTGSVFRKAFNRRCLKLCANGFDGFCEAEDAVEHCYREISLNLNQRDIESGRQLANTGFALGNYNYRIESIAANFVGTAIRDCTDAAAPTSCNSRGYIPYSLMHAGPFLVRNHMGQDFKAELFTGRIEHARGLGSERYISNPISSADTELLAPYTRQEFQGRPLDGNFTVRVWDDEGVDFSKIEDIQVVLHYRYWTRFD